MPFILIALWLLVLLLLILFLIVRYWGRHLRSDVAFQAEGSQVEQNEWNQQEDHKAVAIVLIGGGLLLVWMGQAIYAKVPMPEQLVVFVLTAVGIVSFFWGGGLAAKKQFSSWESRLLSGPIRFLQISPAQSILLFFSFCFSLMARLAAGDILLARHLGVSVAAWSLAVVCGFFGAYPLLKNGVLNFGKKVNITKKDWVLTAVLFVLALLLRGVGMAQIPNTFSGDEGSVGLHALLFLDGSADNLFTGGWFSFPSLYFALVSASIGLLGQTVEAVRFVSALGGALAVVGTYLLGRSMFDRATAVLAALYLAASHYHIHMSRVALNNIWDSVFIALTLAAFWYGWKNNERIGFVISGLTLGLGQYFYVTMRIVPLLLLLWVIIAGWRQRTMLKSRLAGLFVVAFMAIIVVLPLGIYYATHLAEFNAPLNRVTIIGDRLEQMAEMNGEGEIQVVLRQMMQAALGYTHLPLKLLYNPGSPLLLSGAATLFLLGIIWGLLHFDLGYLLLFLPLISVIITSGLSQDPPASQRFVLTMPIVAVFVAIPPGLIYRWLNSLWPKYKALATAVTAVIILWIAFLDIYYYFGQVSDSFVYGGFNTVTATEIATYLRDHDIQGEKVYFFGLPRMGYFSLSTIPYLAPSMIGEDVVEELTEPPGWPLFRPTIFLFLPERLGELDLVRQSYPEGDFREFRDDNGTIIFAVYEVLIAEE